MSLFAKVKCSLERDKNVDMLLNMSTKELSRPEVMQRLTWKAHEQKGKLMKSK